MDFYPHFEVPYPQLKRRQQSLGALVAVVRPFRYINITPLPLFIGLLFHNSPMNNWQEEYFNIKKFEPSVTSSVIEVLPPLPSPYLVTSFVIAPLFQGLLNSLYPCISKRFHFLRDVINRWTLVLGQMWMLF